MALPEVNVQDNAPDANAPDASDVFTLINDIAEARSVECVWRRLTAGLLRFGFMRVNYGLTLNLVGKSIGDPVDVLFLSTHALDRVRAHHETGFYLRTPEYRWVLENVGAVSWGWTKAERVAGRLSPEECAAMDELNANRSRAGYSISFAETRQRSKGAMGLAAWRGATQDDVDAHWRDVGASVLAICNMAHFKIVEMPLPVGRSVLTQRQREMLEWIADGKTLQDICVLTDLSLSSVEKHLRRARIALDVETTSQAVAKAAFLNQMFVAKQPSPISGI